MTHQAYLIGMGMTHFKRWPKKTHTQLAEEAITLALADAVIDDPIDTIYFGNCGMQYWKQSNIKGQVCLAPLIQEQVLPRYSPIFNIEGGCATGGLAVHQAIQSIKSGEANISLAIGVEKTFIEHNISQIPDLFASGTDRWHTEHQMEIYNSCAEALELKFTPHPKRSILLDITSLQAQTHQKKYEITLEQIAQVAVKNHAHGALNPKAQYQKEMSLDEVLQDHAVIAPFTRAMCAPISDGAAAIIVVSHQYWSKLPHAIKQRAIPVCASAVASGSIDHWSTQGPTVYAAQKAYQQAEITPQDIGIAEVHDANAYAELIALEALGLCEEGQAAKLTMQGDTHLQGRLPINVSGGLISKGHPLAASGVAMFCEMMTQLRGEAAQRTPHTIDQIQFALIHNAGGMLAFQEANSVVSILGRAI
jgi:acetyl-CoA acetyltransferase